MSLYGSKGFTLVELLIALAITAILASLAVPSFNALMAKRQVESAATAFLSSLRDAQGSAVARNRNIELIFTTSDPVPASASSATATTTVTARHWLVRERSAADAEGFVSGFSLQDRFPAVTMSTTPSSVGFTPLGRAVDWSTGARLPLDANMVVTFTHAGTARRYCAFITPGGAAGVCDPVAAAGTSVACTPRINAGECA